VHLVTGEMAVCFGTVGPGATNMVPGVAAAWADNIPLLALTPDNQLDLIDPAMDLLQALNQLALYKPITKWNAMIRTPQRAPELIQRAIYLARSGRPGPVHLDIPLDVDTGPQDCSYALDSPPVAAPARPVPGSGDIDKIVTALRAAKRPLLLAGGGVARSGATENFRQLMQRTGFPATTTPKALGVVEFASPNHIGSCGVLGGTAMVRACQEADVILAIGCKFSSWIPINKPPKYPIPAGQQIIQIDIDDEMLGKNTPVALGVVGDARDTLSLILEALGESGVSAADHAWIDALRKDYLAYRAQVDAIADSRFSAGTQIPNTAAVVREVTRMAPRDAIFCADGGQTMEWVLTFVQPSHPSNLLFNPGMGHLGAGLPFANGAKIARPDSPVILVAGDGAAGCTIQELETSVRNHLKIVMIVCNDSHWGMYRPFAELLFKNENFGSNLGDVDFATVARGFGCHAERVGSLEELPGAFKRAMAADGPALLDVRTDFTPHPMDGFWLDVVLKGAKWFPQA
ncbi:MAG: thiamine pyrophosphate-binding protein, partial [Proteobacteria bacterium]|nr:thiamine pyrophosphate-binding protein [Pseudomonadota bacterium]